MKRIFGYFLMPAILIALAGYATHLRNAVDRGDINAVKTLLNKGDVRGRFSLRK